MNIQAEFGELRGNFIAEKRFEAFRIKYNREPILYGEDAPKEFGMMCALVNEVEVYNEFQLIINNCFSILNKEKEDKNKPFHFRNT